MTKIQKTSRYFRILFQISCILLLVAEIATWANAPASLTLWQQTGASMIPEGYLSKILAQHFSATIKLEGFLVNMIPTGIEIIILILLIRLFRQFELGNIFTEKNVNYIRKIGYAILIGQLLLPVYQSLIGIIVTWSNGPTHRMFAITFGTDNIKIIIGALIVILISWIMAESYKLHEEQQLTV